MKYLVLLLSLVQSKPPTTSPDLDSFGNEVTSFLCSLTSQAESSGYWHRNNRFTLIYFDNESSNRCVISVPGREAKEPQMPPLSALCDKDAQPICFLEGDVAMQWKTSQFWIMKADLHCHDKPNVRVHLSLANKAKP